MGTATWGTTSLMIKDYTYVPFNRTRQLSEVSLLPDPSDLTAKATVLQEGGTGRKRASYTGAFFTMAEYYALETDMISGTARTFTDEDGTALSCLIESLSPPRWFGIFVEYDIVLVEA